MAFNLKSIGDIANAISSAKDVVVNTSELVNTVKGTPKSEDTSIQQENMYPERIEKLIRLIMSEGQLDEDSMEML